MLLGRLPGDRVRDIALATVALLFTALTTVLLVWDLDHKERFLRVVFTPQSKSWLARGAFILIAYSGLCARVSGWPRFWDFLSRHRFVVADGAGWILRGRLHGVSFRTVRRPRSVANSAAAGAFDRAGAALRVGGAGAASGAIGGSAQALSVAIPALAQFGIALAHAARRGGDASHHRQRALRSSTDDARTVCARVLGRCVLVGGELFRCCFCCWAVVWRVQPHRNRSGQRAGFGWTFDF
jgi:hypothetical protein